LSSQSNPRQFLKAAIIVVCGIALLINSGAYSSHRLASRSFPDDPKQAVQQWLGLGLIAAGIWFYRHTREDPDRGDDNGAGSTG
jgi:hypothetical protein